jgi:hypothetical protein
MRTRWLPVFVLTSVVTAIARPGAAQRDVAGDDQPVHRNQSFVFSQRTLATPIHVVSGQSITVSVVFSFS